MCTNDLILNKSAYPRFGKRKSPLSLPVTEHCQACFRTTLYSTSTPDCSEVEIE